MREQDTPLQVFEHHRQRDPSPLRSTTLEIRGNWDQHGPSWAKRPLQVVTSRASLHARMTPAVKKDAWLRGIRGIPRFLQEFSDLTIMVLTFSHAVRHRPYMANWYSSVPRFLEITVISVSTPEAEIVWLAAVHGSSTISRYSVASMSASTSGSKRARIDSRPCQPRRRASLGAWSSPRIALCRA